MGVLCRNPGKGGGHWRWTLILLPLVVSFLGFLILEEGIRTAKIPQRLEESPTLTPIVTDMRGERMAVLSRESIRESYPKMLQQMGSFLPMTTVAIEDHRFWSHHGVDYFATAGALLRNLYNGRIISGASSITQQLIKISSRDQKRSVVQKLIEAMAAVNLERQWSKEMILESYLNRLNYGNGRVGPEAASRFYFGKSAHDLTLSEAIYLAGLPQAPSRLNPLKHQAVAFARYKANVMRIASLRLLPPGIAAQDLLANSPVVARHDPVHQARHFVRLVAEACTKQIPTQAVISTSLDFSLQRLAENALRDHLASASSMGIRNAAVVIIDNATGEIRALACGGDPAHGDINSACIPHSCGSTLKPFLYLEAIDQRKLTAASLLPDTQDAITTVYRDYDPQNYSKGFLGPVRVRDALGNSLNIPAVVALSTLGARATFERFRKWGLDFPEDFDAYGAGFILGNAPVRLTQLTEAYSAIARGGTVFETRLTPNDPVKSQQLVAPEAAAIVTDILCDNDARKISFGLSSPLNLEARTAVKTGTSSGFRDGWCVGFNKNHTVGVWAGNLNGEPMDGVLSVHSAAPLWAKIIKSLYGVGDEPLPPVIESNSLKRVTIDMQTGLLPSGSSPRREEWFLADNIPTSYSSSMYSNGHLQLPSEYTLWCASAYNSFDAEIASQAFRILYPKDGAVFDFNPHLPSGQQCISLQCSMPRCEWFLNGVKLSNCLVPLAMGKWHLTARSGKMSATVSYEVE